VSRVDRRVVVNQFPVIIEALMAIVTSFVVITPQHQTPFAISCEVRFCSSQSRANRIRVKTLRWRRYDAGHQQNRNDQQSQLVWLCAYYYVKPFWPNNQPDEMANEMAIRPINMSDESRVPPVASASRHREREREMTELNAQSFFLRPAQNR